MTERPTTYQKAQELAAALKNEAALVAFEQAFKEEPSNYKAVFGAGLMLQRLGDPKGAMETFSKVIAMQPRIAEAHYSRALSLQDLGRHSEALSDLDVALQLQPEFIDATYARGVSLKRLERDEEALAAYSKVLSLEASYPAASHGRATVRHARGDYVGAVADFSDCLAGGMDSYDVRLLRGLAFHRIGRHREAIDDLSRAISLRPDIGSTYIRRWQIYKEIGDETRAAQDLEVGNKLLKMNDEETGAANRGQPVHPETNESTSAADPSR
jgi:tetratricopeptide (TPR) repeat protein